MRHDPLHRSRAVRQPVRRGRSVERHLQPWCDPLRADHGPACRSRAPAESYPPHPDYATPSPPAASAPGSLDGLERICLKCLRKATRRPLCVHRRARGGARSGSRGPARCLKRHPTPPGSAFRDWARSEPALAARLAVIVALLGHHLGLSPDRGACAPLLPDHWARRLEVSGILRGYGSVEQVLVWLNQAILAAWGLASWAFQRRAHRERDRRRPRDRLADRRRRGAVPAHRARRCPDEPADRRLRGAHRGLRLLGQGRRDPSDHDPVDGRLHHLLALSYWLNHPDLDRPYRHFHYLVGLALLGLMLTDQANRTHALGRSVRAENEQCPGGIPDDVVPSPGFGKELRRSDFAEVAHALSRDRGSSDPTTGSRHREDHLRDESLIGIAILIFGAISTLAAHWLTRPAHPLAESKTPGHLGARLRIRFARTAMARRSLAGSSLRGSRRAIVLVHGKDADRTRELDNDLATIFPGNSRLAVALSRKVVLRVDDRSPGSRAERSRPLRVRATERLDVRGAVDWLVARGFCRAGRGARHLDGRGHRHRSHLRG